VRIEEREPVAKENPITPKSISIQQKVFSK